MEQLKMMRQMVEAGVSSGHERNFRIQYTQFVQFEGEWTMCCTLPGLEKYNIQSADVKVVEDITEIEFIGEKKFYYSTSNKREFLPDPPSKKELKTLRKFLGHVTFITALHLYPKFLPRHFTGTCTLIPAISDDLKTTFDD